MDRPLQPARIADPRLNGIDRRGIIPLTILLVLLCAACPVSAQVHALVRPVNLAMLATRAEVIVQGHVIGARQEPMPGYPNIRTVVVSLEVEKMLRGPAVGRFTFRQYLGGGGERSRAIKSGYASGEHVLLFLPGESSYGLRSPLGLEQGHFLIRREANGQEMIANQLANSGLFYRVAEAAQRAGMKLDDDQLQLVTAPRGPVPLRNFTSLLKDLMRLPRNE
jgi:hypothetical protein